MNIIDVNTVYGVGTASTFAYSPQDLEEYLKNNGIDKALTLNNSGVQFNFNIGNENTVKEVKNSSVLLPIATIDPRGFLGELKVLENIKEKGFKAIKFFPDIQGWSLNNIVFRDILELNAHTMLPIIVNAKKLGDITLFDSVFKYDYPVIISEVSYENATEFISFAGKHNNVFVETGSFNSCYFFNKFIDVLGTERIVFGSKAPKNLAKVSVDFILQAQISDTEKANIFSKNILSIL